MLATTCLSFGLGAMAKSSLRANTSCLLCSQLTSVKGPLLTILPASVHLSPNCSTLALCAGRAEA